MQNLAIDIETFSSVDLKTCGLYKYVLAEDFEVLLFSYSLNDAPEKIVDLAAGEIIPSHIVKLIFDPECEKSAHNANFERVCLSVHFMEDLPIQQWSCTMVRSAMLGWPMSLDAIPKAMGLDTLKDPEGKALIRYFCIPCKPTKTNGQRIRNYWHHDADRWNKFKDYCKGDVAAERKISRRISRYPVHPKEKRLYILDQQINDRGVLLDSTFVHNAIRINAEYIKEMTAEAVELTGLSNPNSVAQLIKWLSEEMPLDDITSLKKSDIPEYVKAAVGYINKGKIIRLLNIRQEMSKSSVKKYQSMIKGLCPDGRVRGLLQFWGANRTARWAGRLIQVQNLPKNEMPAAALKLARDMVLAGDGDMLEMLFDNVPDTLSQLIRTAFVAPRGKTLIVSDFSAIEARVIAWLAGEKWRLDVFNTHGKIYEASASKMFNVAIDLVTKTSPYRQRGKMAELALGYQGGPNAIIKIEISTKVPVDKRLPEIELPALVKAWRLANPAIVKLWYRAERCAVEAMEQGSSSMQFGIKFNRSPCGDYLFITLPSGRKISYVKPMLKRNQYDKMALTYMGLNQTTKQWQRQDTYGGKLIENIVQAIARDLLCESLLKVDEVGYPIVMHVHDELVAEGTPGSDDLKNITKIMASPVAWAPGLPMAADSYETLYYKKD